MALEEASKVFIDLVFDCLLDFSADKETLLEEVQALKEALINGANITSPLYQLRQCVLYPTKYFQRLEERTSDKPKIGEVQLYLISKITTHLSEQAKLTGCDLKELAWNENEIQKIIALENYLKPFTSEKIPTESGYAPWELEPLTGKIYSRQIEIREERNENNETNRKAYVNVSVQLGNAVVNKKIYLQRANYPNYFTDSDINYFFRKLKNLAESTALAYAATESLTYLQDKFSIEITRSNDESFQKFVTSAFYFNEIDKEKIDISKVIGLTESEIESSLDIFIIQLIKNNFLSFEQAQKLTSVERRIVTLPFYHTLLEKKELSLEDILGITQNQSYILCCPMIIYLINKNKLSFNKAKLLPPHLLTLINSNAFSGFFSQEQTINWQALETLTAKAVSFLTTKHIARLFLNKVITVTDVNQVTTDIIFNLEKFPHLVHWVESNLCNLLHLNTDKSSEFQSFYFSVYAKRLQAVWKKSPYQVEIYTAGKFKNFAQDSIAIMMNEMQDAARDCDMNQKDFQESMLEEFILQLKQIIAFEEAKVKDKKIKTYWQKAKQIIITTEEHNRPRWGETLNELIDAVTTRGELLDAKLKHKVYIKKSLLNKIGLFTAKTEAQDFMSFAQKLKEFKVLIPQEEKNVRRRYY